MTKSFGVPTQQQQTHNNPKPVTCRHLPHPQTVHRLSKSGEKEISSWTFLFFIWIKTIWLLFSIPNPNNDRSIQIERRHTRWWRLEPFKAQAVKTRRRPKRRKPDSLDSCLIHRMEWENSRQTIHHFLHLLSFRTIWFWFFGFPNIIWISVFDFFRVHHASARKQHLPIH